MAGNIVVLGKWGIGKTSLLRMFKEIAEKKGCIGTIIELGEATDSFITLFETITRSLARDSQTGTGLSASYGPVGIGFTKRQISIEY